MQEELLSKTNCTQRQTHHFANVAMLRHGEFATAPTQVDKERI